MDLGKVHLSKGGGAMQLGHFHMLSKHLKD